MARSILNGRPQVVNREECSIEGINQVELVVKAGDGFVTCPCCEGAGEHQYGKGPDMDSYTCQACNGNCGFPVVLP